MRFASLLLLIALGCNQRLGLTDVAVDEDRDGQHDAADNCPDDANPDQEDWDANGIGDVCDPCEAASGIDSDEDGIDDACDGCVGPGRTGELAPNGVDVGCQPCANATGEDFDRDGIDDACDPCARGDDHDEDGDATVDGCDACPTRADPGQEQTSDTDRLGDACDPDIDPLDDEPLVAADQSPRLFDPFRSAGTAWEELGAWTFDGERAHLPPGSSRTALYEVGLRHVIETVATISNETKSSISISLYWQMPAPCPGTGCLFSSTRCMLDVDGVLTLTPYDTQRAPVVAGTVDISGPVRIWMRSRRASMSSNTLDQLCVAIDKNGVITRAKSLGQLGYANIGIAHEVTITNGMHESTLEYLWLVNN